VSRYDLITTRRDGPVEHVALNRPTVRNAFNAAMIAEITDWAERLGHDQAARAVVLSGAGQVFCAGADATWMAQTVAFTAEQNVADATAMSRMFALLDRLPVPLIGRVHGAAIGGGAGLAAVCDIVVADEAAIFGFTEVRLGIIPAVISPFVLAKIGRSAARELFLTGIRFPAARAREIGLAHAVVPLDALDQTIATYVTAILSCGPEAIGTAKALIRDVWGRNIEETSHMTAAAIAERRASAEGQEGLRAFLEKRRPSWSAE
jgi:methylglutaconyl-CoA hydratase